MSEREPWFKVKVGLVRSDKVGALSTDSSRWGWIKALSEAKTQRRMGVFASTRHVQDVLGSHGKFVREYLHVGLLHLAPLLCDRCRTKYPDVRIGEVVVHDYLLEQRDPTNADRQADHRSRNGDRNGEVTPDVTPTSRARGMTVTVTETEEGNLSPLPPDLDDHLDTWYRLTLSPARGNALSWLNRLADEYGSADLSTALAQEFTADPDRLTVLSRTEYRLDKETRDAEKRRAERLRQEAENERALIETMPPEKRAANLQRLGSMLRESGLLPPEAA